MGLGFTAPSSGALALPQALGLLVLWLRLGELCEGEASHPSLARGTFPPLLPLHLLYSLFPSSGMPPTAVPSGWPPSSPDTGTCRQGAVLGPRAVAVVTVASLGSSSPRW